MNEKTAYIVSAISSSLMLAWMVTRGDEPLKSLGAALMIGSAIFLFVGFFAKPKYQFGEFSILENAYRISDKLNELENMPHHKQIYGQRIKAGAENMPTKGRLSNMNKPELMEICEGMKISNEGTKNQIIERILGAKIDE